MSFAILIPAYKPDQRLVTLAEQLYQSCLAPLVIINDGSPAEFDPIFASLASVPSVTLLAHPANQGKGAALRTGFRYIDTLPAEITCIVTADADGQHSVTDILGVAAAAENNPQALIIGSRQFDKDVPPRSMFGNTITRWVMRLFFGIQLWDTQTGLRGIPRRLLPALLEIPYDRYELEIEMLLAARRQQVPLLEIPIETIYIENNRASHFKPLLDSGRVYFVLFRHALAWLVAAAADNLVFGLAYAVGDNIPLSLLLARLAFLPLLTLLLKKWARIASAALQKAFPRIILLAAVFGLLAAWLIPTVQTRFSITPIQSKLLSEAALGLIVFLAAKVPLTISKMQSTIHHKP